MASNDQQQTAPQNSNGGGDRPGPTTSADVATGPRPGLRDDAVARPERREDVGPRSPASGRPRRTDAPPTPSAVDPGETTGTDVFSESVFLGRSGVLPDAGWRRWVYEMTQQRVNLGPSHRQRREERLSARVRRPVEGCLRIAVVARKGGVGKTTVTLALGHVLASVRPDRTVAIDANPDAGTLGYRMPNVGAGTITDLIRDGDDIRRYSDARLYTAFAPSRLEVIASNDEPARTSAVSGEEYRRAIEVLERHYNLVISDTGNDMTHSVTSAVLDVADQVVVVVAPSLDGARAASQTLDWMEHNGYEQLAHDAVAVMNGIRAHPTVDLDRVWAHFAGRVRAVERVPWDTHLEAGGQANLDALAPATRRAFIRVAAAVMDGLKSDEPLAGGAAPPPATIVLE